MTNTKISKQEKLDVIFRIIKENNISNYEISKNTGISEAGLGSIKNKTTKDPRSTTVDAIYNYLIRRYETKENISTLVDANQFYKKIEGEIMEENKHLKKLVKAYEKTIELQEKELERLNQELDKSKKTNQDFIND